MQPSKAERLREARQHIAEGRESAAMSIYQKIVDTDSSDLAAISMLGDLYAKAGRIDDAVALFLRVVENLLRSGSGVSAAYVLKKVLKIEPSNPVAHMNLGELHYRDNEIERAHNDFIEAGAAFWHKGNIKAAIKMNNRALEIMPTSRHARAALALIERETSEELPAPKKEIKFDFPEIIISIADGSDAVCAPLTSPPADSESQPVFRPGMDEDAAIEQIATSEFLVGCGQVDQAIGVLRACLQNKPDDIQIREKLKDIYLRSEMIDRASEECVNIAAVYLAKGEGSRAADYVARARLLLSSVEPAAPLPALLTIGLQETGEVQETSGEWIGEPKQKPTVM